MATVTGLTADRMLAIEAASVVDGDVIGDNLILTKHDGSQINAGDVRGPAGPQGPVGSDLAVASAKPVLDVGLINQIRAGRQLSPADFANVGLSAPLGLWNLSDLTDASGNGRNLLNKGAVPFGVGINGLASTAAVFAGSTAQVLYISDTGVNDPFRIRTGSWGCWARTAKRGAAQYILGKYLTANQQVFGLGINSNNLAFVEITTTGVNVTENAIGFQDVADDRWHFLVVTFDGHLRLYVDGVPEQANFAGAGPPYLFPGSAPFNIGGIGSDAAVTNSYPFYGRIDEAFVTADVLSDEQVRNLYCAKLPHTLGAVPSRITLNVRRRRKGAALVTADFPTQPLRLHNFSAGSLNDEGSNSSSGTPKTLAPQGTGSIVSVAGADGTLANGYSLSGSHTGLAAHDGLSLPAAEQLPSGLNPRSFGGWFKLGTVNVHGMVGWSTAPEQLWMQSNGTVCYRNGGDDLFIFYYPDGQWHFFVCTADNAAGDGIKRKVYLDGRCVGGSTVLNSIALGGANNFRVGAFRDGTFPMTGHLDGVFVCGYVLTAEQIAALYAKGSQILASSPKNEGDHIEAMTSTDLLATFDLLQTQHQIDLKVAA